jgi:hypothetical protein
VNESDLIRHQLATEREHAGAAARACAAALERAAGETRGVRATLEELCQACIAYLGAALTSFEERDLRLADLMRARLRPADPVRRALEELLTGPGGNREVLEKLAAVSVGTPLTGGGAALASWHQVAQALDTGWRARRAALEAQFARYARVADWRTVGGIDADSILAERARYAQLRDRLPDGALLAPPGGA